MIFEVPTVLHAEIGLTSYYTIGLEYLEDVVACGTL